MAKSAGISGFEYKLCFLVIWVTLAKAQCLHHGHTPFITHEW